MSEQLKAALIRALIGATLASAGVFFATLGTDADWRQIIAATGAAFVTFAGWRVLGEGLYDQTRADRGDVKPGDVGPKSPAGLPPLSSTSGTHTPPPNRPGAYQ